MLAILIILSLINLINAVPEFTNCISGSKQILLTFDDGIDVCTKNFSDTLNKYNIKGVFFINGAKLMKSKNDDLVKSLYANNHVIGTHTFSHPAMSIINDFNKLRELYDNELYIFRRLFNNRPYLIRSPYFDYDDYILNEIYSQFGYIEIDTSFESTDWMEPFDPQRVISTIKSQIDTKKNIVNLIHDNIPSNMEVLEPVIKYALLKGYTFVDPKKCFGLDKNYQEDNIYSGPLLTNGLFNYLNS